MTSTDPHVAWDVGQAAATSEHEAGTRHPSLNQLVARGHRAKIIAVDSALESATNSGFASGASAMSSTATAFGSSGRGRSPIAAATGAAVPTSCPSWWPSSSAEPGGLGRTL